VEVRLLRMWRRLFCRARPKPEPARRVTLRCPECGKDLMRGGCDHVLVEPGGDGKLLLRSPKSWTAVEVTMDWEDVHV